MGHACCDLYDWLKKARKKRRELKYFLDTKRQPEVSNITVWKLKQKEHFFNVIGAVKMMPTTELTNNIKVYS